MEAPRQSFNKNFSDSAYKNYLASFEKAFPHALDFRVAESPIFIDKTFLQKMLDTGDYVNSVIQSHPFKAMTENALKYCAFFPNETALPDCIIMDFAITLNKDNKWEPALIEIQGFPSLFAFEILHHECLQNNYTLPMPFSPYINGYNEKKYKSHLDTILNKPNKHTVLLEILPHQQKTRIDFYCTEKYFNIPIICLSEIFVEGNKLFYLKNGKKIKIDRIFNRIVLDELKNQSQDIQEKGALLQTPLEIEWVTHPHHFFRISKFLLPFLKHKYIPTTLFANSIELKTFELEKFILKPLFSFAGQGVIIDIQTSDIDKLKNMDEWIIQEKVEYANCIDTPTGPAKAEIRLFYFWDEKSQKYIATMNLARLSKGKMIGVDYNKDKQWVGGSLAYFEMS